MKRQALKKADHRWLVGVAIFGVVFAAYVTLSIALWNAHASHADSRRKDMRADLSQLSSAEGSIPRREQLTESLMSRIESVCQPPALIAWQQYAVARAAEAVRVCEQENVLSRKAVQSYIDMTAYLQDEQYFSQVVREAIAEDQATDSRSYDAHAEVWTTAAQQIAEYSATEAARNVQGRLRDALEQTAASWNSTKGESYDGLLVAYDELSNVAPLVAEERSSVQAGVERQVRAAVE